MELTEDATPLDELVPQPGEKIAMILGNEGRGVRPETLQAVDQSVIIDGPAGRLPECGRRQRRRVLAIVPRTTLGGSPNTLPVR